MALKRVKKTKEPNFSHDLDPTNLDNAVSDTVTVMTEKLKLEDVITALISVSTDNTDKIKLLEKKVFYLHLMMLLYVIAAVCHGVL